MKFLQYTFHRVLIDISHRVLWRTEGDCNHSVQTKIPGNDCVNDFYKKMITSGQTRLETSTLINNDNNSLFHQWTLSRIITKRVDQGGYSLIHLPAKH